MDFLRRVPKRLFLAAILSTQHAALLDRRTHINIILPGGVVTNVRRRVGGEQVRVVAVEAMGWVER